MNDVKEERQTFQILIILVAYLINAKAELLSKLHGTFVVVGDSVNFTCSSNISADIHWEKNEDDVYAGGTIKSPFDQRFLIDKNETTATFTLILLNATLEDAAEFKCRDDQGRGQKSSASLTVLESYPQCQSNMKVDGFVGPNGCDIPQDVMTFTCAVSFKGKNPPLLTWSSTNISLPSEKSACDNGTNRTSCSLDIMPTKEFDGSSITCLMATSEETQYNCNIRDIKVNYFLAPDSKPAEMKVKDEIFCLAESNQALRFTWTKSQDNEETTVGYNRSYVIQSPGLHWYNVSYTIRGVTCFSVGPLVYAKSDESEQCACYHIIWISCLAFGGLLIGLIFVFIRNRKRNRRDAINRQKTYQLLRKSDDHTILNSCQETIANHDFPIIIETKASRESECPIYGLAILGNELFTISRGCKEFEVYDYKEGSVEGPTRCCQVEGMTDPRNIVACGAKDCLYIENMIEKDKLNEIIRVDKDGKMIKRWKLAKDLGRISITTESNVLVTVRNNSSLREYTPEGKKVRRRIKIIDKEANVKNLRHALLMDTGHYVLCHGDNKDDVKRVCIVDKEGKVLAEFGDKTADPQQKLTNPQYLAVHPGGSILLVDGKRIVLLNRQLHFKKVLLKDEDNMRCTFRVCLDIKHNRLLVTDNDYDDVSNAKGRVLVYNYSILSESNQLTNTNRSQNEDD